MTPLQPKDAPLRAICALHSCVSLLGEVSRIRFQGERSAVEAGTKLKGITRPTENPSVQPCRRLRSVIFCPDATSLRPLRFHSNLFSRLELKIKITLEQKVIVSLFPRSSYSPTHAPSSLCLPSLFSTLCSFVSSLRLRSFQTCRSSLLSFTGLCLL